MTLAEADAPADWTALAEALARERWRRLVVVGAPDRGKSTFIRFLAVRLARESAVALLDCDLGQKAVGPPGCVTLGSWNGAFALERLYFVGATNPIGALGAVVAGAARLAASASAGRLLVNTSGLVSGPGLALKRLKIEALDPERIVVLARDGELGDLLAILPPERAVRLAPSPFARRKGRGARERVRRSGFEAALAGAPEQDLRPQLVERTGRDAAPPGTPRLAALGDAAGEDLAVGLAWPGPDGGWRVRAHVDPARVWRLRLGMALTGGTGAVEKG